MGKQATASSPSLPRIGELIAGKYTIDRILATGGMGVVVAAKHVRLEQRVAIKFLLPEMLDREELVARFLREAQATVGLHGEHAVRVYDVGTLETGSPYLVMELLRGNDLDEELEVRGPLEVEEAINYVLQACEAIAEAHRLGIVHRDIKPSNLFLARRPDGSRIIKVVDFGISKLLADEAQRGMNNELTTTTAMLGSPQYMSPEQVRSAKDVDGQTDIWSLGCVLYEMLANVPPFSAETISAVSAMIVADKPPPLRSLRGDAPADLCKVVMRCLEKNREQRYRTVAELAEALIPFASTPSREAIERVVRISHAPRYRSSFPPPANTKPQRAPASALNVRADATTVSEVTPGGSRPKHLGQSDATLSATSGASELEARAHTRRNGLLVATAALLAGLLVWLMLGRAPPPDPQRSDTGQVRPAALHDPKKAAVEMRLSPPDNPVPDASSELLETQPEPKAQKAPVVPKSAVKKKAAAPARRNAPKPNEGHRKANATQPDKGSTPVASGRGAHTEPAISIPAPSSVHHDPLSSRK